MGTLEDTAPPPTASTRALEVPTAAPVPDLAAMRGPLQRYLQALWQARPPLLPIATAPGTANAMLARPFLSELGLHLPRETAATGDAQARRLYYAATAHAAAHLLHSRHRHPRARLRPIQIVLVGLLEDARVEWLAIQQLPGLRDLWLTWHDASPEHGGEVRTLLRRLSRALLDPAYEDPHPWVAKGVRLFGTRDAGMPPLHDPSMLRDAASRLGNDIGQMRLQFNARTYLIEPAYRDDNAGLFLDDPPQDDETAQIAFDDAPADGAARAREVDEAAQPDTLRQDARALRRREGRLAAGDTPVQVDRTDAEDGLETTAVEFTYPEWDRLIDAPRAHWTRVLQTTVPTPAVSGTTGEPIAGAPTRRTTRASALWQTRRQRAQPQGDALDIDAFVRARIDAQLGHSPDWRVWTRAHRRRPPLDVLMLMDQSASTAGRVLAQTRAAVIAAAHALQQAGDRSAIDGFCSAGRHRVLYQRYKSFEQTLDADCLARLSGMDSRYSTRFGAALRHATHCLTNTTARGASSGAGHQRLVLLITDGEPHDIDIFDPRYLVEDARQAVREAHSRRVPVFCVSLDAAAAPALARIFGRGNFLCIDRAETLLARLPQVCARAAR